MEISNKTLAWFVIGAVVVSLAGTLASFKGTMTGYVASNDTGLASVNVAQSVILRFAINSTNFGSGSIDSGSGYTECNLSINGSSNIASSGCVGFNSVNPGGADAFVLENAGTSYLNVTINFTGNASTFIGGTNAKLQYAVSNNESNSCQTLYNIGWTDVGAPNQSTLICYNMSHVTTQNTIRIGMKMSIPTDALSGSRSITLLAQGTSLP